MSLRSDKFFTMKNNKQKIMVFTAYDAPTASMQIEAGVDIIHVGDSVGTTVLGYASETEVTMSDMLHHLKAVRRGAPEGFITVDMPHRSYESDSDALKNARALADAGADMVKVEGPVYSQISAIVSDGIEVCAHLGLTPQTYTGKRAVQGKEFADSKNIFEQALKIEEAGARLIVLELVSIELAAAITNALKIPTIGIGSGVYCDGQIQVYQDVVGYSERRFRHAAVVANWRENGVLAFKEVKRMVENEDFPTDANASHLPENEAELFTQWLQENNINK